MKAGLEALLAQYFPLVSDRPAEIHCTDIRRGKGAYSKLSKPERNSLLAEACQLVTQLRDKEVALFTVVVDKPWWFGRHSGKSGDDLYLELFENLVSRFDLFLKRRYHAGEPAKGLIIADPAKSALSRALRTAVLQFHRSGTRWAELHNVIESVLFLESHESPGLQLADLCSYSVWRAVEYGDPTLVKQIRYAFDRESHSAKANAGKWHGVRYDGPHNAKARQSIATIWPT